jgi:hypothetical protein
MAGMAIAASSPAKAAVVGEIARQNIELDLHQPYTAAPFRQSFYIILRASE